MADEHNRSKDANEPFRQSESGAEYNPQGNWGAERQRDHPRPGAVPGMEGAPSGAGDGGYGPEGDYGGADGDPNADASESAQKDPRKPND
jgi:hypothetical protein